jgi:hypothetical protein
MFSTDTRKTCAVDATGPGGRETGMPVPGRGRGKERAQRRLSCSSIEQSSFAEEEERAQVDRHFIEQSNFARSRRLRRVREQKRSLQKDASLSGYLYSEAHSPRTTLNRTHYTSRKGKTINYRQSTNRAGPLPGEHSEKPSRLHRVYKNKLRGDSRLKRGGESSCSLQPEDQARSQRPRPTWNLSRQCPAGRQAACSGYP